MVPPKCSSHRFIIGCNVQGNMGTRIGNAVLLACLLCSCAANGQLDAAIRDSLRASIAGASSSAERLEPLRQLAWTYLFSEEALPYLKELDSLTSQLEHDSDPLVRTRALSARSRMFYQRGYQAKFRRRIAEAQQDFLHALDYGERANDVLDEANAMDALGVTHAALHLPAQALLWYEREYALIMNRADGAAMYTSNIRQHKADVLMRLGRLDEAEKELMLCDSMEVGRHVLTLMGRGHLAAYRGDTAKALGLMAYAEQVVERSPIPWEHITVWEPYARFLLQTGDWQQALNCANKAIDLADRIGDYAAKAGCLVIAGQAAQRLGDLRGAEQSLTEALSIAKEHGYVGLSRETGDDGCMVRAAELLRALYRSQGRMAEAMSITDLWVAWKDSLRTIEDREELLRFDLEQAALVDSIADAQRLAEATDTLRTQVGEERQERQRVLIIGGTILASTLLLLAVMLGRRKRERMVAEHTLQRSIDEHMIRDLKQRERMSEDLHEELGAGLSALKLWSELDLAEEPEERKRQLLQDRAELADELVTSLRQIIWAMNSPTTTVKNLVDYLNDAAHLYCAQHGLRLRVEVDQAWPSLLLSADQRRDPYLVLKEALVNTVKHSAADRVELRMHWRDGFHLEIEDNGKGIQGEVERLPGNGIRTMQRRVAALGGHIRFDGQRGMRVMVFIPLSANG